jgi:hypothetical protein
MKDSNKLLVNEFKIGDHVHHHSNINLILEIMEIHIEVNEIMVGYNDPSGKFYTEYFMPEELVLVPDRETVIKE